MNKILVIAPHPDDETLGCGGTLLKHKDKGDEIFWLIVTNIDEINGWEKAIVEKRQREINAVSGIYNFKETYKLDYPTTRLDTIPLDDLILSISKVMRKAEPDIIYLPNRSDIHSDHRIVFNSVLSASKVFRMKFIKRILMYECLSETEFAPALAENAFLPNYFVDISEYIEKKTEILKIYESEIMDFPFPRSEKMARSLAAFRGSTANVHSAEAFVLIKEIA